MLTVYVFLFSEQSSSLKCDGLPRRLSLLNLRITIYIYIYIFIIYSTEYRVSDWSMMNA